MADRMRQLATEASALAGATTKKIFADALEEAGIDAKATESEAAHEVLRAIEALLVRAQRAGAVGEDVAMPELLGLLAGACIAARQQQWDEPLRTRTLGVIFDGLRG